MQPRPRPPPRRRPQEAAAGGQAAAPLPRGLPLGRPAERADARPRGRRPGPAAPPARRGTRGPPGHSPGNGRRPRGAARRPAPRRPPPAATAAAAAAATSPARSPPPCPRASSSHEAAAANAGQPTAPAHDAPEGRAGSGPCCISGNAVGKGPPSRRAAQAHEAPGRPPRVGKGGVRPRPPAGAGSDWPGEASDVCAGFCSPLARASACVGRLVAVGGRGGARRGGPSGTAGPVRPACPASRGGGGLSRDTASSGPGAGGRA